MGETMALKVERAAWRVKEFMEAYGIGRTKLYSLINSGQLRVLKSGRVTLIPRSSIEAWHERSEAEGDRAFKNGDERRGGMAR